MSPRLAWTGYGKAAVRLVKVVRDGATPQLFDLTVNVQIQGDFTEAHVEGRNAAVLPTDTMKNTVYALAREYPVAPPEEFGIRLARHFIAACPAARSVVIDLIVHAWEGAGADALIRGTGERGLATVTVVGDAVTVEGGLEGLGLLKTGGSAFGGFLTDRYTTLQATSDRLLATDVTARWKYARPPADWDAARGRIRSSLIGTFASHRSESVQQTLYLMGTAALAACAEVEEIRLVLPNRHHVLVDLSPFGLDNPDQIYVATAEPYGRIEAVIAR